jgi:hypothetical protein
MSPLSDHALGTQISFIDPQNESQYTGTVHWILDWTERSDPCYHRDVLTCRDCEDPGWLLTHSY